MNEISRRPCFRADCAALMPEPARVCPQSCLCVSVGLLYLSPSLRLDDRVFLSRRWARLKCLAGEDTGVESRPALPPLPVGSKWSSCKYFSPLFISLFIFLARFRLRGSSSSSVWPQISAVWAPLPCSLYTCRIITGFKQTKQNIYFSRRICAIAVALAVRSAHGVSPFSLPLNSFRSSGTVWFFERGLFVGCEGWRSSSVGPYLSGWPAPLRLRFNTPVFVFLPPLACF